MSDISINITWFDLLLFSPFWGWPGIFVGGVVGALVWRTRPILGGVLGALAGNFLVFGLRILFI
jgi:hypothetical protein